MPSILRKRLGLTGPGSTPGVQRRPQKGGVGWASLLCILMLFLVWLAPSPARASITVTLQASSATICQNSSATFWTTVSTDCTGTYLFDWWVMDPTNGWQHITPQPTAQRSYITYNFAASGACSVYVSVQVGACQGSAQMNFNVRQPQLQIDRIGSNANPGGTCTPVQFWFHFNDTCNTNSWTAYWNFGDPYCDPSSNQAYQSGSVDPNNSWSAPTPTHQYAHTGTWVVTVTLVDGNSTTQASFDQTISGGIQPPGNVTATATSAHQVSVSWTPNGAASYKIWRTDGVIPLGTATASPYLDNAVQPAQTYSYYVTAVDACGNESTPSAVASVTTSGGVSLSISPSSVTECQGSTQTFTATASNSCGGSTSYQWSVDGAIDPAATGSQYTPTLTAASFPHTISCTASAPGCGSASAQATARVTASSLSVSLTGPSQASTCSPASFQASLQEQCGPASSSPQYTWSFGDGATQATTTNTVSHQYTQPGTYSATVTVADGNLSATSNGVSVTVASIQPPWFFQGSAVGADQVNLSWNPVPGTTQYRIYRATDPASLSLFASTTSNSWTDWWVNSSTTYYYYVTSVDSCGNESGPSNTITVTTPVGLSATLTLNSQPPFCPVNPVAVTAAVSPASCAPGALYYWYVKTNGAWSTNYVSSGTDPTYSYSFSSPGSSAIGCWIYTTNCGHVWAETDFTIASPTLTASPSGDPNPATTADVVTFSPNDAETCSVGSREYHWDFGDGQAASTEGGVTTHQYTLQPGETSHTYTVTLTITDTGDPSVNLVTSFPETIVPPLEQISVRRLDWWEELPWDTSATVAAGGSAIYSPEHWAEVMVTATKIDGVTPAPAGSQIIVPTLVNGAGRDGGDARLYFFGNTAWGDSGTILGFYFSSNLRNTDVEIVGPGDYPASATISQAWADPDDDARWNADPEFQYGVPDNLTYRPRFVDDSGNYVPITSHTMQFMASEVDLWTWNDADAEDELTVLTRDTSDPTALPLPYVSFSPETVWDAGQGSYSTQMTVTQPPPDANGNPQDIEEVDYDIVDPNVWDPS